jgi:hypothetical protein
MSCPRPGPGYLEMALRRSKHTISPRESLTHRIAYRRGSVKEKPGGEPQDEASAPIVGTLVVRERDTASDRTPSSGGKWHLRG